jgi:hypothetical protein
MKMDTQGCKPESPFWLGDLTGLVCSAVDRNPRVDWEECLSDFREDLSGLWLVSGKINEWINSSVIAVRYAELNTLLAK